MTEHRDQKIANLKAQIVSLSTTCYLQELVIKDAEDSTGNEAADARLRESAKEAAVQIATLTRQLVVRNAELKDLEAE